MIDYLSFIDNFGEYAYDCELTHPNDVLLREQSVDDGVLLIQTYGRSIVITNDTMVMNGKGEWVRADSLKAGDELKRDMMDNAVIQNVTTYNNMQYTMFKIVDCKQNYLIVNGFYILCDM